jgi:hypothetical protein
MTGTNGGGGNETECKKKRRIPIGSADGWTAIATIFLVFVGGWGVHKTDEALELSQRAWLSAIGAGLLGPLEKNSSIHFQVNIMNSGKEPAHNVTFAIKGYTIAAYDTNLVTMDDIIVPGTSDCSGLVPKSGKAPIAPNLFFSEFFDSAHSEPVVLVDDSIVDHSKYYALRGCIAYETFGRIRHSAFCYILAFQSVRDAENNAAPNVGVRQPAFSSCGAGFDAD